jgi:hypothetical protein
MQTQTLKLPLSFTNSLLNLPETGMGYQVVKVVLKSGRVLNQQKVINAELLMIEGDEDINEKDIEAIELESKTRK